MKPAEISVDEGSRSSRADSSTFVDVRDLSSWASRHLPGAVHVGDHNIRAFIAVYSMSGGFAEWHGRPVEQSLPEQELHPQLVDGCFEWRLVPEAPRGSRRLRCPRAC